MDKATYTIEPGTSTTHSRCSIKWDAARVEQMFEERLKSRCLQISIR